MERIFQFKGVDDEWSCKYAILRLHGEVELWAKTLTKISVIEKEVEEYEASAVDMVLVEEEVKEEAINFVVEDEIAEVNIEETNFVIRDEKDEVMEEFIEEIKEQDNSRAEIVIVEENNFVDANKVVEKEVNLVEPRKEFHESTSTSVCSIVDEQAYETEEL
ncbi:unnamed protein product [Lactuca saligna]|uniref:Uncharacterized protein n=1 Tax=Lactuca saligna TaxID=75948 RepID=A0AA35VLE9_LACSI|nr:unnamed protein product [Lactuca saligna]